MALSKKILLIEGDANLLYGLQAKLRVEGFAVIVDEGFDKNGLMDKIKTLKPDFIILDIILPQLNGFELLEEIKADPALPAVPIFIFTNLSDKDSRQKSENLGVDFYFLKNDFNLDEFVAKFKKIISNLEKIK